MWNQDKSSLPSFSLFHTYKIEEDLLLIMLKLEQRNQLDTIGFDWAWRVVRNHGEHNMLCKMIACGGLNFTDSKNFFVSIGHLGAQILMFYMELED